VDVAGLFIRIRISQGSPWAVEGLPVFMDAVPLLNPVVALLSATPAPATCAQLLPSLSPCSPLWFLVPPSRRRVAINCSSL
jgi:hypothetical protein